MKRIKNVRFWRHPDMPGIEACRVIHSSHVFPNHAHESLYALSFMETGASYCLGENHGDSLITSGNVGMINPGQVHSGVPAGGKPTSYLMIYVDINLMLKTAGDICETDGFFPEFETLITADANLSGLFRKAFTCICNHSDSLETGALFTEMTGAMIRRYGSIKKGPDTPGKEHRSVRIAMDYLSENLDRKLSLNDVASEAGFSRYHFLRVFKAHTGLSPHAFRTQRRIDEARRLIQSGKPFADVALDTGFTDQSHFTHKFRDYTGATPGQYLTGLTPGIS